MLEECAAVAAPERAGSDCVCTAVQVAIRWSVPHLRRAMYPREERPGSAAMTLRRQSENAPYAKFVENARWERAGVIFGTLHVVGSNNNRRNDAAALSEYGERNAANLAWIDAIFERARQTEARAVVLFFQANPFLRTPGSPSGFADTLDRLAQRARAYDRPVLLVHGDGHRLLIDQPLAVSGRRMNNVTRLMVFGDIEVHGVLVTVDSASPDTFSYTPVVIPPNITPAE